VQTDGGSNVSSVSARMDLSPMSGRGALIPATACDRSSAVAQVSYAVFMIQQTSSKLSANAFKIHMLMLDVCWIV